MKSQKSDFSKIEALTNSAALTLMLLDDQYTIFASDHHDLAIPTRPILHIYDFECDNPDPALVEDHGYAAMD